MTKSEFEDACETLITLESGSNKFAVFNATEVSDTLKT